MLLVCWGESTDTFEHIGETRKRCQGRVRQACSDLEERKALR